jgi:hypothetical protein
MKMKNRFKCLALLMVVLSANPISGNAQEMSNTLLKYDETSNYPDEELRRVSSNGKHGFVDFDGNEVISLKYEDAFNFRNGLAPVMLNGKWGYIDKTGAEVIACKYDIACNFPEDIDITAVWIDEKYGFIDKTGKEITPVKYVSQYGVFYISEKPGWVGDAMYEGDTYSPQTLLTYPAFTDKKDGKVILIHPRFVELRGKTAFHEGFAIVSVESIECSTESQKLMYESNVKLYKQMGDEYPVNLRPKCWGFIDTTGKEVFWGYLDCDSFGEEKDAKGKLKKHRWLAFVKHPVKGRMWIDIFGNEYVITDDGDDYKILKKVNKDLEELEKQEK